MPGEGIGVVMLKRLKEAIADGDHIYGVIRGSGINQDGTTNGITAPSANSQERLECEVYDTFSINPEQIQMVEAHGTGTKLGDPIEYQALTKAFRKYTDKKEYCAIGSIKTNIGHTLSAAGAAGVIKILLSIQHKQIPPTLHFQRGNSNIEFEDSPFYVNTGLKDWDVRQGSKRCAVISSFGFSGTNAHIVIEEAAEAERFHSKKPGYLIVLSARTQEQLQQQAEQLVKHCEDVSGLDCGNISYTLVIGRKHFNHRLACVINNQDDLIIQLKKWLKKGKTTQVYTSELNETEHREKPSIVKYGNQCIDNFKNIDNGNEYLENLSVIADLYVQRYELEYEKIFSDEQYSRISLPTYPFARERYWIPEGESKEKRGRREETVRGLHPLLQENTSNINEQRYSSKFTGEEFFLRDHVIGGEKILPGAAYLEMARAAVEEACNTGAGKENRRVELKNIVWASPIRVNGESKEVHIGIYPEEGGEISFEVYSRGEGEEEIVHSQGRARINEEGAETERIDIERIKRECSKKTITGSECYEIFKATGIEYGPGHQAIKELYTDTDKAMAKLVLPESVGNTEEEYVLHPSMIDGALQAAIGLAIGKGYTNEANENNKPSIPFALEGLEVYDKCQNEMWAVVRKSEGSKTENKVKKVDIDICDKEGKIHIRLKRYSTRTVEPELGTKASTGTLIVKETWEESEIKEGITRTFEKQIVILVETGAEVSPETIEEKIKGSNSIKLQEEGEIDKRYEKYALRIFKEIQSIIREKTKGQILIQLVVPIQGERYIFTGLTGILKTAGIENPKIKWQIIETEGKETAEEIIKRIEENTHTEETQIQYKEGRRYTQRLREIEEIGERGKDEEIPWKEGGVYIITGGAGGLGLIYAKEIIARVKNAKVILTGRSKLNKEKENIIKEMKGSGSKVEYREADITDKEIVSKLIGDIKEKYGKIDGIIHSAGIIEDNYIVKKTTEEFKRVLQPKVTGLVNIDEATKDIPLEFIICFSSISAFGSQGQADYAAANAFMDAYTSYRNRLAETGERQGRTMSIRWPLWEEGGMKNVNR